MTAQICAACGRGADDGVEECPGCGAPTKPNERYRLRQLLSHHGSRVTYAADDELRGERVVIKELMLRAAESLKLRAYASDDQGALEVFASRTISATTGNSDLRRPRRREAWRGFGGDMKLFLLGLVVSVLLASYAGASVGKAPFAAMSAMVGSVLWLLWAMFKRFRRAQLYTSGRSVRGVVTARHVTQQTFSIDYRYQVDGVAHVATEKVIRDTFVRIEEGDEIAVWYNPRHPAVATLSVIADQRGQLPV